MTPATSSLSFEHHWGRAIVAEPGGETDLLIRIVAGSPSGRQPKRAPVDVAFILDRSGSMGGEKIQVATGKFYSHRGQLIEITSHFCRVGSTHTLFGDVFEARGGTAVLG